MNATLGTRRPNEERSEGGLSANGRTRPVVSSMLLGAAGPPYFGIVRGAADPPRRGDRTKCHVAPKGLFSKKNFRASISNAELKGRRSTASQAWMNLATIAPEKLRPKNSKKSIAFIFQS
jgi:hypothetical protein